MNHQKFQNCRPRLTITLRGLACSERAVKQFHLSVQRKPNSYQRVVLVPSQFELWIEQLPGKIEAQFRQLFQLSIVFSRAGRGPFRVFNGWPWSLPPFIDVVDNILRNQHGNNAHGKVLCLFPRIFILQNISPFRKTSFSKYKIRVLRENKEPRLMIIPREVTLQDII